MELNEIRERINNLNDEMLALFMERMKLSEAVAAYKKEHKLPILDKTREREILAEMIQKGGAEYETYIYQFFNTLMNLSKARQSEILISDSKVGEVIRKMVENEEAIFPKSGMIACQGVEGANSQEACDRLFPHGSILYVNTFEAVFQAVQSGLCKFGVLPIENSANGSVRTVYELLQKYRFYVVRSTRQWIHHTLLVKPGTKLADVKTIYSHQQAIGQCSVWLEKMKGVNVVPAGNTAIAAKMVADAAGKDCAAIASPRCAELYGLEILEDKIQDSDNNYTRFICISKEPVRYEGANHISLIVSCANTPGSLYEMLSKPASLGINMIKLESCPIPGRNFEFVFFVELEASVKEPAVLPMIEDLERSCPEIWFLGNYAEI
ncbi:MAG: chorismate mutase [Anaerolineaceae bacterium]|nr:chorismate mutase [Anaerolineaceae bacterium]